MAVGAAVAILSDNLFVKLPMLASWRLIGILVGSAAAATIALAAHWPVLISPSAAALAWAFAGVVGIAFGLYPAFRASRLDPIVALRFE
jgi:ABC-type antimicrobial peptide transport system permease subunit